MPARTFFIYNPVITSPEITDNNKTARLTLKGDAYNKTTDSQISFLLTVKNESSSQVSLFENGSKVDELTFQHSIDDQRTSFAFEFSLSTHASNDMVALQLVGKNEKSNKWTKTVLVGIN